MKSVLGRCALKIKVPLFIVVATVVILAGLSACAQDNSSSINNQPPIKIGISLSLKADFAQDGQAMAQGYQLWADMVNKNGGLLGRPVKLFILDDQSDPGKAAANYNTLIHQDRVDLVFGPFSSLLTKAASPVVEKAGYAFIEGAGGGPSVFQNGWHNLFAVSVPVTNNLVTFAYYILSLPVAMRPKTAAYATSDDPFTAPQLKVARDLLESGGVTTVYKSPIYPADTTKDVTPYAEQIVRSRAQVVLLGTLLPDATTYIKVFKREHYNPQAIIETAGPDLGNDFIKGVGGIKNTEGIFVPNGWYPQAPNFQNAQMVQAYLAQYGGTPDQINADVAEAFSVGQVLQQAVSKIHSISNAKLISQLHSVDATFNTVQGIANFDPAGRNQLGIAYLFQWQHGQFMPVYPASVAAENPEFPKAVWVS